VDGQVHVFSYSTAENKLLLNLRPHKKACRGVQFTEDGQRLYTISTDTSIKEIDLNSSKISWGQGKAHDSGINAIMIQDNNIFTGDDEGVVKVWDDRSKKNIRTFAENEDFISDFALHNNMLLCPSGDGTLSIFDLRKGKLEAMSEDLEDELLSIVVVKNGSKVICGSQGGLLHFFSWGDWSDANDKFPGHPESIDTIVALNEEVLCTGSSDGLIRVVNILPNKFLGVVGEHEEFPIEGLDVSRDMNLLASCSHDNTVKFWNISYFWEEDAGEDEKDLKMDMEEKLESTKIPKATTNMMQFFSDL